MMLPLLAGLRVRRPLGRPRTRPGRVLADKAYSSRAIRTHLRARGIGSVIPDPDDQKAHRRRRGSRGGRPVTYDRNAYRGRNVIERAFNGFKHWRGLATRYDKHAVVYRGGLVLAAALLWISDLSGVVASVLGVEQAFGEFRSALVRHGGELHENGSTLDDVRAGLAEYSGSEDLRQDPGLAAESPAEARTYGGGSSEMRVLLSVYGSRGDVEPVAVPTVVDQPYRVPVSRAQDGPDTRDPRERPPWPARSALTGRRWPRSCCSTRSAEKSRYYQRCSPRSRDRGQGRGGVWPNMRWW